LVSMFIKLSQSGKGFTISVNEEIRGAFPRFHFGNADALMDLLEGKRKKSVPVFVSTGRTRQDREEEADSAPSEISEI